MMSQVTLRFASLFDLWQFQQQTQTRNVVVVLSDCTVTGSFRKEEVELACSRYKGEEVKAKVSVS
jgi:hypothetical protein